MRQECAAGLMPDSLPPKGGDRFASRNRAFFLVTCEHGGNRIPSAYRSLFAGCASLLQSHRGYDAGALQMARKMARALDAPLIASTVSRLLIDLNRSPHHRHLYSDLTRATPPKVREAIFRRYYLPYRNTVEQTVAEAIAGRRQVLHISCHSFTPVLDGERRNADIGLLFDPARSIEAGICRRWQGLLAPHAKTRLNYPYRGVQDGLTSYLRRRHGEADYCGIEIEINQAHVFGSSAHWKGLQSILVATLAETLHSTGILQSAG